MPFRASFDCLWCGAPYRAARPDDLEGWAQLCPACLGRAGENPFLRFRLRAAMDDRARSHGSAPASAGSSVADLPPAAAPASVAGADGADVPDHAGKRGHGLRGPADPRLSSPQHDGQGSGARSGGSSTDRRIHETGPLSTQPVGDLARTRRVTRRRIDDQMPTTPPQEPTA